MNERICNVRPIERNEFKTEEAYWEMVGQYIVAGWKVERMMGGAMCVAYLDRTQLDRWLMHNEIRAA